MRFCPLVDSSVDNVVAPTLIDAATALSEVDNTSKLMLESVCVLLACLNCFLPGLLSCNGCPDLSVCIFADMTELCPPFAQLTACKALMLLFACLGQVAGDDDIGAAR